MLALEGSAAEILKDIEDSSPSVYTDIWTQLARRFGMTDGPREAMRRFDNRRQQDSESVQEFEQSLRVLYRDAWPKATATQRDSALKRRFEDGLINLEMAQFLRLHARNDDFPNTVLKARQFAEASDTGRHRKSVRFLARASNKQEDDNVQTLLDGFRGIMNEYLAHNDTLPRINNISTSSSLQRQSPARQGFQSPRSQSPAPQPQGTSPYAGCVQNSSDFRRQSRTFTRDPPAWNGRTQSPDPPRANGQPSPSRYGFQQPRQPFQPRQSALPFVPRENLQGPRTPSTGPPVDRRPNFQGQRFQSPGARFDRNPPPDGFPTATPRPSYGGNMQSQTPFFRTPPRSQSIPRRKPGCWVCGRFGCHSDFHSPSSEPTAPRTNLPNQPSRQSTNPFHQET